MLKQVKWPPDLDSMWGEVLDCTNCRADPTLAGKIRWDQYVPLRTIGILPPGSRTATYVVVGAEPSGAGTIKSREASIARQRAPGGVRNFNGTRGDLTLQFSLERWLLDQHQNESYYLTDLAKCRIEVGRRAAATAEQRYANCARWFGREVDMLRPRAIIAVGKASLRGLRRLRGDDWPPVFEISHYGASGVRWWKESLKVGWEALTPETEELDHFAQKRRKLSLQGKALLSFTPSYRWLLALYRVQLGAIRRQLDQRANSGAVAEASPQARATRREQAGP